MKYILVLIALLIPVIAEAQLREYRVHSRGMLHETVYNSGEIGRAYHQGQAGNQTVLPIMEWPARSRTVAFSGSAGTDVEYDGQHNTLGGGIFFGADAADTTNRMFAYSGGAGSSNTEQVVGISSFPQVLHRVENFPLLENGELNPAYNPDEAEEIITARWGTPLGLTVTRVSRAWSFPDYDDLIIYEYEIEHTGDRDGNPATIQSTETLNDVLVGISYGFAPNMFAFQRHYDRWHYNEFEQRDQRGRWDRTRWLRYTMDVTGKPDPYFFTEWSRTGRNGGGLTAPQAAGFSVLYYDYDHLATVHETGAIMSSQDSLLVWDANGRIKQPWTNRMETSNTRSSKIEDHLTLTPRRNPPYRDTTAFGMDWIGRGTFNVRQSMWATGNIIYFGPYTLQHGDKIRFAVAQVVGYGAASLEEAQDGLVDEGGSCGQWCGEHHIERAFNPVPTWYETVAYGGPNDRFVTYGNSYLAENPLPEYINSDVVTVRDVTDKAIYAFTGEERPDQYWPEQAPAQGVYRIPIPVPAPVIHVSNTAQAENEIAWGPYVEAFEHPRLQGQLQHYEVRRAAHPLGPWQVLASVTPGDPAYFQDGRYLVIDEETRVGESFYYAVIPIDQHGNQSGMTNLTLHETQIGGTETLERVHAVPNPFIVSSGFEGGGEAEGRIGFYNLPREATIRIYSYSGQLVETIEHESELYSTAWLQVTRNHQLIASGVYFFVVETPDGQQTNGRFVVIR